MTAPDPQLARVAVLLAADRPQPEPTETEVRQILDHITGNPQVPPAETTVETTEAGR